MKKAEKKERVKESEKKERESEIEREKKRKKRKHETREEIIVKEREGNKLLIEERQWKRKR